MQKTLDEENKSLDIPYPAGHNWEGLTPRQVNEGYENARKKEELNWAVKLFYEKKKRLVCDTCGKEFEEFDNQTIGEHAMQEHHYSFILKGTNLHLAVL